MTFITIGQYFNKLQIVFVVLLIMPLLAFIALYTFAQAASAETSTEYYTVIPGVALLEWLFGLITFDKKIKSARNAQGLAAKLDKYFFATIVRSGFLASASLVLAAGYFLTRNEAFTGLYLVSVFLSLIFWPTGPKVAGELRLKGDEREMIYFKKDKFS